MKKYLLYLFLFFLVACSQQENKWKEAKSINTISLYQQYLSNYPTSPHSDNAKQIIDSLELISVIQLGNVDSLQQFIKTHSSSVYKKNAESALDSLEWYSVQKSDSIERYQQFLNIYPGSKHSTEAKEFIETNLSSEYKTAIELMLHGWFKVIEPQESEGIVISGSLMVNFSGEGSIGITLDSLNINKFKNLSGKVVLDMKVDNVTNNYAGTHTVVKTNSKYLCKLSGKINCNIAIISGEFDKLGQSDYSFSENTMLTVNKIPYKYLKNHWIKI
jgi:hypothetical protein